MLARLLQHHVLANLTFLLVLVIGFLAYNLLPRQKDPTINFNWININTPWPGAAASDVEKLITDPIESAVSRVADIKFVTSTSREGISTVLVRFQELDEHTFDKRLSDLRREIQQVENSELPAMAESPIILEITSSNAFPTATLVLQGQGEDERLRRGAWRLERELERLAGVDRVDAQGRSDPELQIEFDPLALQGLGLPATAISDTIANRFRDLSAGTIQLGDDERWLLRLIGTDADPDYLAALPLLGSGEEVTIGQVATIQWGRKQPDQLIQFQGQPAIMLTLFKRANTNTLETIAGVRQFIAEQTPLLATEGLTLVLIDDQTVTTRNAIAVMEGNAIVGLLLVLLVTWIFLGSRISLLVAIGIPFTLAGTFWLLYAIGQSLNNSTLLGVVISLGMLVDDAVVVVESIYYRLQRGMVAIEAAVAALREVFAPVTASVITTIAAFMPLMLMPGILGQFMMIVPLVVTLALLISLLEAYWMLPAHIHAAGINLRQPGRVQRWRNRFTHHLRVRYARLLIKVLRRPIRALLLVLLLFFSAIGAVAAGLIHFNFFAMETLRLFYVNIEMPAGSTLQQTLHYTAAVETQIRRHLQPDEVRGVVSYAGLHFTDTAPLLGDHYGQVLVSLEPRQPEGRDVDRLLEAMRADVTGVVGPQSITFLKLTDGPPVSKPISIKVRGDDFSAIRAAVNDLKQIMATEPAIFDISDNDSVGRLELRLQLNDDAIRRAGLDAGTVRRLIRLLGEGEVVTDFQAGGEKVDLRVRAQPVAQQAIDDLLQITLPLATGGQVTLRQLVTVEVGRGSDNIRHHNLRRAITVEADIDKRVLDTVRANAQILAAWQQRQIDHPTIQLDFSGELDDINESLDSILLLFLFGIGVIYLILGTQFSSYWQPLMILSTVPMAFTGVVLGLLISGNPLSLYTLYGVVALAGIAVNAAIVLISAANQRMAAGMSLLHAIIYAARRRVIPILITAFTTIAGLFSLATGLGGHSLVWGPVATAIVWGLAFSTLLTLFLVPLLYRLFMRRTAAAGS